MDVAGATNTKFNLMRLPHELILKVVEEVVIEDCKHFSERWIDLYRYRATSHLLWETCHFMEYEVPKTFSRRFGRLEVPQSVKDRAGQSFKEISRGDSLISRGKTLWAVEALKGENKC